MASRQEEKEQRRLEREQQEAVERRAAARKKRAGLVFGGLLGSDNYPALDASNDEIRR